MDVADPIEHGVLALEAQRRTKVYDQGLTDGSAYTIGSFAQVTKVTADSIETRILKRWPDKFGAPISPDGAAQRTYFSGFGDISFRPRALVGLKAATDALRGINSGASSNYDTTNSATSGYVSPTTSSNTQISTSGKTFVGTMNDGGGRGAAFDGNTNQAHTAGAGNAAGQAGYTNNTIGVDWGSGVTKTVVEFRLWAPNSTALNGGSGGAPIKLQGSNDGSNWTDLYTSPGSVLASASSTLTVNSGITTTTAYRYHQIAINGAGGGSGVYLAEVQFYEAGTLSNMTLVTTAQTADASVTKVRALIEFDNTASLTAGTDFTIEATCNGGTNWTAAGTYTVATSNSNGGRRVVETDEITCTAGTSAALRLKTLTNKNMPVYGLACEWS